MKRHHVDDLQFYQSEFFNDIRHGIFTRHGGLSAAPWSGLNVGGTVGDDVKTVRANHDLMYQSLKIDADNACTTWQVHGADVVMADSRVEERKWVARADGIMTNNPDVPLVMRFADCVPLLFYDAHKKAIGLAHAGWRGTVQGMGKNMIHAMQHAYGSQPSDICVVIGPSISLDKFQVGEEVVVAFSDAFGDLDGLMQRDTNDGTAYIDLWEANRRDLAKVGVEDIEVSGICTYQNTDDFYSHRAEKGKTGRFGVVMQL